MNTCTSRTACRAAAETCRGLAWLLLALLACSLGPRAARAQETPPPGAPPTDADAGGPGRVSVGSSAPPLPSLLRGSSVAAGPFGWVQAPKHRVVLNNLLVVRVNPAGLEDQLRTGYQYRISDRTDLLFRDTFVFLGLAPRLNPAFIKIGPSIEIQPLSIFNLRFAVEYMGFFSTFGFLQSFGSASDDYSDPRLKEGQDARRNYVAHGAHVMIEPLVQLRLGPVALRNRFSAEYWHFNLRDGDRVFYEVTLDTVLSRSGWVLANDLDLLFLSRFGLTAGVRYSVVKALYGDGDFADSATRAAADNAHHRVGPLLAYTFFDRGFTRFNKPTILLIANWYVRHRFRTGAEPSTVLPGVVVNSQAMPYAVLAFSFQSDLLNPRRTR